MKIEKMNWEKKVNWVLHVKHHFKHCFFTQLYQYQGVLPVDHIPGHSQHAGDPSATHHPATHKQGSDTDCLEPKNCTNIKINWLDKILESKHKYQGFL